jgi:hypothetical protein
VLLTGDTLYVANTGEPLSPSGVETLMASHMLSPARRKGPPVCHEHGTGLIPVVDR